MPRCLYGHSRSCHLTVEIGHHAWICQSHKLCLFRSGRPFFCPITLVSGFLAHAWLPRQLEGTGQAPGLKQRLRYSAGLFPHPFRPSESTQVKNAKETPTDHMGKCLRAIHSVNRLVNKICLSPPPHCKHVKSCGSRYVQICTEDTCVEVLPGGSWQDNCV